MPDMQGRYIVPGIIPMVDFGCIIISIFKTHICFLPKYPGLVKNLLISAELK